MSNGRCTIIRNCQKNGGKSMIVLDGQDRVWDCPGRGCPCQDAAKIDKPTPRVIELLGYVEKGWIGGTHFTKPRDWRSYTILVARYGSGIRNPSAAEITKLLSSGLCDEIETPGNHDTYDTSRPTHPVLVGKGKKLTLTPQGRETLRQDSVCVMIAKGEYRAPEATVRKYGTKLLDALNNGRPPRVPKRK